LQQRLFGYYFFGIGYDDHDDDDDDDDDNGNDDDDDGGDDDGNDIKWCWWYSINDINKHDCHDVDGARNRRRVGNLGTYAPIPQEPLHAQQ